MCPFFQRPRYASVDIGSHTIRLLAAALEHELELRPLRVERRITRLAQGFGAEGELGEASIERSMRALREYSGMLRDLRVHSIHCGATGVLRRAGNASSFLRRVEAETGLAVRVLPEEEEALLSAKGILTVLPETSRNVLAFDLGGSSTEFMLLDPSQSEPLWVTSVFLGAATLTENHIGGDPPEPGSVKRAKRAAREELAPVFREVRDRLGSRAMSNLQVVGTAGTATTLAAIRLEMEEYEPYRVNGLELSLKWLQSNLERLASLDFHARARLPGLEAGRADIILGGAAIVGETLAGLESDRLTVTDAGLLEGLLLDGVERARRLPPALRSPLTFARKTS